MNIFTPKRKILKYVKHLEEENTELKRDNEKIRCFNSELADKVEHMLYQYPITCGETLYEVCLRNEKGRFTKTNPSKEHSYIEATVVDTKNYFKLAEKYRANQLFLTEESAKKHLDSIC